MMVTNSLLQNTMQYLLLYSDGFSHTYGCNEYGLPVLYFKRSQVEVSKL